MEPRNPPADSSPPGVEENQPGTRRVQIMPNGNYAGKLMNLADNYLYVAFYEEGVGGNKDILMGKVIKVRGQEKGKSWKPANKTTAFLLYLLNRENHDSIAYDTFSNLVKTKFNNVPDDGIDKFLKLLETSGALDTGANNTCAVTPDPLNLFTGTKIPWENPDFMGPDKVDFRSTHGYSSGWVMITIWK
jgi:hypothetical protein